MSGSAIAKLLVNNSMHFRKCRLLDVFRVSSYRYQNFQSVSYHVLHRCGKEAVFPVVKQMKNKFSNSAGLSNESEQDGAEIETLYRAIDILVIGHENSVLESFMSFCQTAASELDITVNGVLHPRSIFDRMTLLKSIHIYKKHRVQYESRTHRRVLQVKYLTSSTANVYLEYIQRNLPAGVAMHVHKWEMEKFPEHILKKVEENAAKMSDEDWDRECLYMNKMKVSKDTSSSDYEEYETTKKHLVGTTM